MLKLDVHSTAGLTAFAIQHGIIGRGAFHKAVPLFTMLFTDEIYELIALGALIPV